MVGQAGPDNPYRFGPTPSKYVRHLAKIAPVGRFGGVVAPAVSPSNPAISPYDSPYTAITRPVASPSIGTNARPKTPPLATGQGATPLNDANTPSDIPSLTTTAADSGPSIAPNTRAVIPTLSNGSGSIPSPPSQSPARSPSPDAEALIASLENYESLSDDALYDAALAAQQAMVKWQDEYMALETEINRMKGSPYHSKNPRAKPRKLADPEEYDRKHHASLYQPPSNIIQSTGKNPKNTAIPLTATPINDPPPKGRGTRNELHIDMTAPMQPLEGKRIRKPRIIDNDIPALPAHKKTTKRAREPDNNDTGNTPAPDHPPLKKQHKQPRDLTPPPCVRTARDIN